MGARTVSNDSESTRGLSASVIALVVLGLMMRIERMVFVAGAIAFRFQTYVPETVVSGRLFL